ncbi:pyrroline-5-carboxylate reductase [Halpernia frigidisoli]|uniref:Pyrroline-5-carboxylate reductase n=1 Tax=Halpernia frigidisoli TaxID=1125876 RepID=A0A1I3IT41_9FLAO|nr:pyrroline-5-carboxylate reductase [Halpernia frigidisoli]SFI51138.1 pyrroline-5-carboxylate reductase [Halpernia frigidisoli]
MKNEKVAIIGAGNLGKSIIQGLIDTKSFPLKNITATKRNLADLKDFEEKGITITSDNSSAVEGSELIIVALKPHNILSVLEEISSKINPDKHIIVSLATGISIAQIQKSIGKDLPIYRAMPNTAADVQESVTCICSTDLDKERNETVKSFFNSIGSTIQINEDLMEAATVIGACGIAYVLRFIRAMIQGGIEIGFDANTASKIVTQTVKGASELLIQREQHPEFEIDKVTTPKGCTIAGLNEMEHNGFSSALIRGIVTSYKKIEK